MKTVLPLLTRVFPVKEGAGTVFLELACRLPAAKINDIAPEDLGITPRAK